METGTDWVIRVTNVPLQSEAAIKMNAIAAKFGQTNTFALAGALNYELVVGSLTGEQAILVQEASDAAADSAIGIKVFPSTANIALPDVGIKMYLPDKK
jgi:hypothetical protein